jgi:hypothetical protein
MPYACCQIPLAIDGRRELVDMIEMNALQRRLLLAVFFVALVFAYVGVSARSSESVPLAPVTVLKVDTLHPGSEFVPGAVGFSIEARELSTGHLNAGHYRLVRLMRLLGPSVLRIGGNTVDLSWWTSHNEPPPAWATSTVTPADLYALHHLLSATGWHALLGVNLGHFEPVRAGDEAREAQQILGTDLVGIEIGNEPDDFGGIRQNLRPPMYSPGEYLREAEAYRQALNATAPGVALYGPAFGETKWLMRLGTSASMYAGLTQHYYPTGGCPHSPPPSALVPAPTAGGLLSPIVRENENEVLSALTQAAAVAGRRSLIGETNVVACGDRPNAGPQFASALWALDWSLRAASRGVTSLSFHGQLGPCGSYSESPICAANGEAARAGDIQAQPEYYGLLAAHRLEGGRFVPTRLSGSGSLTNLTTWATLAHGATLRIAIDNLASTGPAQPVHVSMPGYVSGSEEMLLGSSAEARSGIAFGTAPVTRNGQWRPRTVSLLHQGHVFRIVVPPASAVILTLRRQRS